MNSASENILPKGWRMMCLKDKEVCELIMGQSPSSETYNLEGKGLPFFQGKKEFGKVHPVAEKYCSKPSKIASPGDILMSVRAPVGPTNIADVECCIGRGLAAIRHNPHYTLKNYLLYYFKNFESEFAKKGKGSTFSAITKGALEESTIFIPPLEEQKRIVAKLDSLVTKIDKAISLTEESLKQAKNLLPSVLSKVFEKGKADGWEENKLGEIFKDISSGFACSKRFEKDGGYVHLRTHNISTNGVLNFDKIIEIEESKVNIRSSKIFKGDVIFNNTNSTELVGKTSYVDRDYDYGYSNHLTVIKTSEESEGKYLTYFLNHLQFTGYFMRICKKWIGQSGINTSMLKDLDYCCPPLEQQKTLVSMLDRISNQSIKSQSKFEEQLSYLRQLKSSILSKAFKGEL